MPCFEEAGESPLPITCCRCRTTSVYVLLTDGTTTLRAARSTDPPKTCSVRPR
jgi:hypothetical protein